MAEKEVSNQFACDEAFAMYMDEKTKKIVQAAMVLDVYSKNASPKKLLGRVLVELGDEDDNESTFFEQVNKMEAILYEIGDLPNN